MILCGWRMCTRANRHARQNHAPPCLVRLPADAGLLAFTVRANLIYVPGIGTASNTLPNLGHGSPNIARRLRTECARILCGTRTVMGSCIRSAKRLFSPQESV